MPVVDALAQEYADRVAFVAPAWKASQEATAEQAAVLMPSGAVQWGLDTNQGIFTMYGVPYQPATVLVASDGTIVESWLGARSEADMRAAIENLLTS